MDLDPQKVGLSIILKPGFDTQGATMAIDGLTANLALVPQGASLSPLDRIGYAIGVAGNTEH